MCPGGRRLRFLGASPTESDCRYPGRREGKPGVSADQQTLAKLFEASRPHLQGVAYRMLGSLPEADDAPIVGRSPEAARQLASRARRRVRGAEPATDGSGAGLAVQRRLVEAFLAALRSADFEGLVAVLGPEFVIRADATASPPNGSEVRGAETWAKQAVAWARGAKHSRPVLANGSVGVVLAPRGRLQRVLLFTFVGERIADAVIVADPARLRQLDLSVLPD